MQPSVCVSLSESTMIAVGVTAPVLRGPRSRRTALPSSAAAGDGPGCVASHSQRSDSALDEVAKNRGPIQPNEEWKPHVASVRSQR